MRPFHSVTVRFGPPVIYEYGGEQVPTGSWGRGPGDRPAGRAPGGPDQDELRALTDAIMGGDRRTVGSGVRRRLRQPDEVPPGRRRPGAPPSRVRNRLETVPTHSASTLSRCRTT